MTIYQFKSVLFKDGWRDNCCIEVNSKGMILNILDQAKPDKIFNQFLIPGLTNAHSHSFQYAMAGMTENLPKGSLDDNFWSWRENMYDLALKISPDDIESICEMLFSEMLRNGYTDVVEFHYLHKDTKGNFYKNRAETSERIIQAAEKVGINLTLIPIFYQKGDFDQPAFEKQKRFIHKNLDEYFKTIEELKRVVNNNDGVQLGLGAHSLRAVETDQFIELTNSLKDEPFHIHISEQQKEVTKCLEVLGKRPIEWLFDNTKVTEHFNLVHATHLNDHELNLMAKSKTRVVICPSTEGNLGDGFFPLVAFALKHGEFSIGSDSHINLNPFEELRLLEYGQRMLLHQRNILCQKEGDDSGEILFKQAFFNGRIGSGRPTIDYFEVNKALDGILIDSSHPTLIGKSRRHLLSSMIFTIDSSAIIGTMIKGQLICKNGVHRHQEEIRKNYEKTLRKILNAH